MLYLPIPPPLLAMDNFGLVIIVVMAILSILGWIRQQIAENQPPAPAQRPRRPPPQRRNDRVQDEIDLFLKEVSGSPRREPDEVPIEIVPDDEVRQRPVGRRPRLQERPRPLRPAPEEPARRLSRSAATQAGPPPVGAIPAEGGHLPHLASSIRPHIVEPARERLQHGLGGSLIPLAQPVEAASGAPLMGESAAQLAALQMPRKSAGSPTQVAGLLRDPESLRQAMLVNAILSPPRSRHR